MKPANHSQPHRETEPRKESAKKKKWITPSMESVAVMETYNTAAGASGDGIDPQYS